MKEYLAEMSTHRISKALNRRTQVATTNPDPHDRFFGLIEFLLKDGETGLANHIAEHWTEHRGRVIVTGLRPFGVAGMDTLAHACEKLGFICVIK